MSAIGKEVLNQWVAAGFDENAVAAQGTSVEQFRMVLQSGQISWSSPRSEVRMLPYQKKLLAGSGYLYYACPFLERTRLYRPTLSEEIEGEFPGKPPSIEYMIKLCRFYANMKARRDFFQQETGQFYNGSNQILALAGLLFPRMYRGFLKDPEVEIEVAGGMLMLEVPTTGGLDSSQMSLPQLRRILQECLKRKGVLIYFNNNIFQHKIVKGIESESEIVIISKEPMTTDVISGIQILSNADRRALRNRNL